MSRTGLLIGNALVADWRDDAVCATTDPDLFFPDKRDDRAEAQAKKVCKRCPVREQCLEYALENEEEYGIWGMTSPEDRLLMRQEPRP